MLRALRTVLLLLLVLALGWPSAAGAEGVTATAGLKRTVDGRYFPLTGHNVSGAFLRFFEENGGVDVFGYPRTEAFEENGRLVQYFQRHRMEWWPENPAGWQVQLALIGDLVLGPADPPVPPPSDPAYLYFPQTGHSVGPPFRQFFTSRGGPKIFGYPTSEAYQDGPYLVQRFQRARLEWQPQNPPAYQVQPSLLGDVYLFQQGKVPAERTQPLPEDAAEWYLWGSWTMPTDDFRAYKLHNNELAARTLDGKVLKPGEVFRFSSVLAAPGYQSGYGYGEGDEYIVVYAGGICAGATVFYRAAFNAGLAILEVHPHTLVSYQPFGWDATIAEGRYDVAVRNDTPTELRIRAHLDREAGQLTAWIEGRRPPDRTVVRRGPYLRQELTYEVFRDITYADGRRQTEKRTITYVAYPKPLPAE